MKKLYYKTSQSIAMPRKKSGVERNDKNPYMQIGASIAGIFMVIVLFTMVFAEEQAGILVPIAWALAFLGAAMGFFQSKSRK